MVIRFESTCPSFESTGPSFETKLDSNLKERHHNLESNLASTLCQAQSYTY